MFGLPVLLDPVRKLGRFLKSYKTTKEYVNIALSATRQQKLKQSSVTATGQGKMILVSSRRCRKSDTSVLT